MAGKDFTLTQEYLKEALHYDPDTGVFTWLAPKSKSLKPGDIAGAKQHDGNKYRIQIMVNGKVYYRSVLAYLYMVGKFPELEIDHDDGNSLNDKWKNLNHVTKLENLKNKRQYASNTSGCTGVTWYKQTGKWFASIMVNKECDRLGYFGNIFDAAAARKSAENKYGFHKNHGAVRPL